VAATTAGTIPRTLGVTAATAVVPARMPGVILEFLVNMKAARAGSG
jgi:hypothetical protein